MAGPNDLARAGGRSEDGTSGDAGERACMPSAVVSRRRTIGEISDPVVAAGGVYLQTEMANAVQEWFRAGQPGSDPLGRLSQQERRILALIAEGKTNRDIAAGLGLSEYTVKTYVSSALSKLGLSSRAQAAAFVVRHTGP